MTKHYSWTHIEAFKNVNRYIDKYLKDDKPVIEYRGKIKLHGTNAAVQINKDGVFAQSRNNIITPESDNAGFARWRLCLVTGVPARADRAAPARCRADGWSGRPACRPAQRPLWQFRPEPCIRPGAHPVVDEITGWRSDYSRVLRRYRDQRFGPCDARGSS